MTIIFGRQLYIHLGIKAWSGMKRWEIIHNFKPGGYSGLMFGVRLAGREFYVVYMLPMNLYLKIYNYDKACKCRVE